MSNEVDVRLALANEYVKDEWFYASQTGITDTNAVALKAATVGKSNCLKSIQFCNPSGTITLIQVLDGTTVIWQMVAANNSSFSVVHNFPISLKGTVNTALNFKCVSATGGTGVFVNAQGYQK